MMRRLPLLALLLLAAFAFPRGSVTTGPTPATPTVFAAGADCNASITVSGGGLTLTSGSSSRLACRANPPKFANAGKLYFEVAMTTGATHQSFGVGNNGASLPSSGGTSLSPGFNIGAYIDGAGLVCPVQELFWHNVHTAVGAACANGKVSGIALDLNANPSQIWETPDVTSLLCDGAGHSGTTAPQWNGTCASDPSLPGTGGPTLSGIVGFYLPSGGYFPMWYSQGVADAATFNFGASTFAVASVPAGFSAWNNGAAAPNPGPTNPLTINLANAPEWQTSHAYNLADRIVAGPAWAAGSPGSYTNGQDLFLWAVVSAGTSSGSGNGPQGCATPAAVGGGLDGTIPSGWSGATHVTDGGVTWVCLTKTNYVTATGLFGDEPNNWAASTTYNLQQWVINGGSRSYQLTHVASGTQCTSGATGPTGTTFGATELHGDGCTWAFLGNLTYTSKSTPWPHQNANALSNWLMQYSYDVHINVWYGGAQRRIYQPGQNGESIPIMFYHHQDIDADLPIWCAGANNILGEIVSGSGIICNGFNTPWTVYFKAAPGDGRPVNTTSSTPLRVDSTLGVTWFSNAADAGQQTYLTRGEPLGFSDNAVVVQGMQFQSTTGPCVDAHNYGPGGLRGNLIIFQQDIFDCGGGPGALLLDGADAMMSSVVIGRSAVSGYGLVSIAYPGLFVGNTFICPSGTTNATAIQSQATSAGMFSVGGPFGPPPWKDNVFIGCAVDWAYNTSGGPWASTAGANNATTNATGASGTFTDALQGVSYTRVDMPGVNSTCVPPGNSSTCNSLTASAIVVNPAIGSSLDLRVKSGSPVIDAGANFSFPISCTAFGSTCDSAGTSALFGTIALTPDIDNTTRPGAGGYDIGAYQTP